MRLLHKFKQIHIMYYVSLLYLVFPFYYSLSGGYPFYIFWLTILFIVAYLGIVMMEHPLVVNLFWLYLCFYVVFVTFNGSPNISMFNFFLSNILVWRFGDDKLIGFRYISFYLVFLATLYPVLADTDVATQIFLLIMDMVCLGMLYAMRQIIKQTKIEQELTAKNASINLLLAENERNRIGQDLHDTLGHVFAMLSVKSELALTLMEHGAYEKAQKEIQDLRDIAKNSMQEVREIVQAVKVHSLEEELQILGNMLELAGIALTIEKEEIAIGREQETALTMALRELGNNLIKHSQASSCRIQLSEKDGWVRVLVEDNGIGFEQVTGEELHSIRDRFIRYQGRMEIISSKQPTQIQLEIPKGDKDEHFSR
ncbi:sensor histidine kinase [Streptococcus marmotae]|uniref:sensor histidine kinase n=1 Tax=Streptococcus marmotae TaxID=1825069 RepID=UPI00082A5DBD|nr:sensor histidine kinase [Streptococcus marmotae]